MIIILLWVKLWSSQCAFNLNCWKSILKKIQVYPLSYQATWIDGQLWVRHIPDDIEYIWIWIYEYHICELRINMSKIVILAVCFQLKQLKKHPEKIRLERDSYIHIHIYSLSSGMWRTHNWSSIPCGLIAQWRESTAPVTQGHGFEFRSNLNFFQDAFAKKKNNLDKLLSENSTRGCLLAK